MKRIFTICFLLVATASFAQTKEELESLQSAKKDSISALQSDVDALQTKIDEFPGWHFGAFGTIGANLSEFNNWYAQGSPDNSAGNITITVNPYAKLNRETFFWYTTANVNLSWVKFDDKDDPNDDEDYRQATDIFTLTSLYGYKFTEKLAASALVEYRTTLLNNFNDPGYLDLGVGITWTPIPSLIVVAHPLNYNFVFSNDDVIFDSSLGFKLVADYSKSFGKLKVKSNLSLFQSYEDSNLSNWTWTNALGYEVWRGIGLGFEFGLRDNKQEALNYAVNTLNDPNATFDNVDNDLQTYWTFGLSYAF
ncbi:conserved hypothetical protein (DUF3078) [Formosa agariphila KMM 3901]|uniref:DUF3078 domain-containing protein n=1 Tax=Formosa agariphila (strain DSM 15362 / KCTC 12365 / LMG 23005 / KMM 3901 / M-2Alg 35-1) TaxID=1347342 RepID=T2KQ91_FORAG|nr:DUF3078 domain-containing protein [Formosa agariphila]CDF81002.1 conserved hypothetical protein (DUF3078) [Formosa agariphila KMM 3901]